MFTDRTTHGAIKFEIVNKDEISDDAWSPKSAEDYSRYAKVSVAANRVVPTAKKVSVAANRVVPTAKDNRPYSIKLLYVIAY